MGARSKKIWLDIDGTNTGRSFGGESIGITLCVGTSATNSNRVARIYINSWESGNEIHYELKIDGQRYIHTSFNRKTKEFGGITGHMICGDPAYLEAKENKDNASMLRMVGAIASMGEIFCDNKKEKNDWKMRMIKAGVPEGALHMPEDWDSLSEEVKEERLNKVIQVFQEDHKNG